MPGQHQNLYVPLSGGIESDIEDTLLPVGKSLTINNMSAYESGTLRKRFAYATRSNAGLITGPSPTWQLGRHKGADIALGVATPSCEIWAPTAGRWAAPAGGATGFGSLRRGPLQAKLQKTTASGVRPQMVKAGGYIWIVKGRPDDSTLIEAEVIDPTTSHVITKIVVNTGVNNVQDFAVATVGTFVVVATQVSPLPFTGVRFYKLDTTLLTNLGSVNFALPGNGSLHGLDLIASNATTVSALYVDNAGNVAGIDFVPSTSTATGWTPQLAAASIPGDAGICWVNDLGGSGKVAFVAATNGVAGLRMFWDLPASGATRAVTTAYTLDAIARTQYNNIVAFTTASTATGAFQVLYTFASFAPQNLSTNLAQRDSAGVLTGGFQYVTTAQVVSKGWTFGGDFFVIVGRVSATLGASYVLCTSSQQTPQAQFAMGISGALNWTNNTLGYSTEVIPLSANTFLSSVQYIRRLSARGDGIASTDQYAIALVTLTHATVQDNTTGPPIEAVDSMLVPGGTIGAFDGFGYAEMGHASAPDTGVLTPAIGGAMTANSTYWYQFVWAYQDSQGRTWRSAPSLLQSVTIAAAAQSVVINAPAPAIYSVGTGSNPPVVEIYRGAAGATTPLQKVTQVGINSSNGFVNYTDAISDTALAAGETIYTTGGILPAEIFPGSSFVFVFQNRVWFVSNDDSSEIWFSDLITPKNGPRFNSANVVRIADGHGAVVGAAVFDDKVVALKADAIYTWNGDGPDAAGNGQFSQPQIVALGVGTTFPRSIVATPDGVMFDSVGVRPGIQMIDRSLALAVNATGAPIGEAVLRYTGETIMSSIVVPDQSQARFYCLSGLVLVYDFIQKIWMTHDLKDVVGSLASASPTGSGVLAVNSSGGSPVFLVEDITAASYLDLGTTAFASSLGSPWIQVDGVNGFERVMGFIGKGLTVANHSFRIDMYIDYQTTIATTKTFVMTTAANPTWNWEWIPRIQRMKAFKLVFTEINPVNGAAFRCNGFTAKLGLKSGLGRQATVTRG